MKYIIKDTITDLTKKENTQVFYTGRDGYVHSEPKWVWQPYKTEKCAYNKIQREMNWVGHMNKINDYECIEGTRWHHKYEIIKVGA